MSKVCHISLPHHICGQVTHLNHMRLFLQTYGKCIALELTGTLTLWGLSKDKQVCIITDHWAVK